MVEGSERLPVSPDDKERLVGSIRDQLQNLKDAIGTPVENDTESDEVADDPRRVEIINAATSLGEAFAAARADLGSDDKAFDLIEQKFIEGAEQASAEAMLLALIDGPQEATESLAALAASIEAKDLADEQRVVEEYLDKLPTTPFEKVEDHLVKLFEGVGATGMRETFEKLKIDPKIIIRLAMSALIGYAEKFTVLGPEYTKMLEDQRFKQEKASLDEVSQKKFSADAQKFENEWRVAYRRWAKTVGKTAATRPSLLDIVTPAATPVAAEVPAAPDTPAEARQPVEIGQDSKPVDIPFKNGVKVSYKEVRVGNTAYSIEGDQSIRRVRPNADAAKTEVVFLAGSQEYPIATQKLVQEIQNGSAESAFSIGVADIKLKRKDDSSPTA